MRTNPNFQTTNPDVAGSAMELYGQQMALVVFQSTCGTGRLFSHTVHLIQQQEKNFSNIHINSFFASKTPVVPDLGLSSYENTLNCMSGGGSLTISDCVQILLRVRDFPIEIQKKFIFMPQDDIHGFVQSFVAPDTVFFLSGVVCQVE